MYLSPLKALLVDSLRKTFDDEYVVEQWRNLWVDIEFPDVAQKYPSIWVDFEHTGDLQRMGIGHWEYEGTAEGGRRFTRWRVQGYATYTIAAMTSLERDDLFGELVRVFAFGGETEQTSQFRTYIEDNALFDLNMDFDEISVRGATTSPGTPWGSDEMIYEITVAMEVVGEFASDSVSQTLLPLNGLVVVDAYSDQEPDPDPTW